MQMKFDKAFCNTTTVKVRFGPNPDERQSASFAQQAAVTISDYETNNLLFQAVGPLTVELGFFAQTICTMLTLLGLEVYVHVGIPDSLELFVPEESEHDITECGKEEFVLDPCFRYDKTFEQAVCGARLLGMPAPREISQSEALEYNRILSHQGNINGSPLYGTSCFNTPPISPVSGTECSQ